VSHPGRSVVVVPQTTTKQYEPVAADAVAEIERGTVTPRDVLGAPPGTHDYHINCTDGRRLALEVTTAANPVEISMWNQITRRPWECPTLGCSWTISVAQAGKTSAPNVKQLRAGVERLVAILERAGRDSFEGVNPDHTLAPDVQGAIAELGRLGARRGKAIAGLTSDDGAPLILVGSTGPEAVNEAVTPEAEANADKLARAPADERHLFVWMHPTSGGASLMVWAGHAPELAPALPDAVDVVWVARHPDVGKPVSYLWRAPRGGAWDVLRHPVDRQER
jgi:hypothetical protein